MNGKKKIFFFVMFLYSNSFRGGQNFGSISLYFAVFQSDRIIHNLSPRPLSAGEGSLAKNALSFNSTSPPLLWRGGRGERLKDEDFTSRQR